jgi:hypothetical protein
MFLLNLPPQPWQPWLKPTSQAKVLEVGSALPVDAVSFCQGTQQLRTFTGFVRPLRLERFRNIHAQYWPQASYDLVDRCVSDSGMIVIVGATRTDPIAVPIGQAHPRTMLRFGGPLAQVPVHMVSFVAAIMAAGNLLACLIHVRDGDRCRLGEGLADQARLTFGICF